MPTQVGLMRANESGEALMVVQQQPEPLNVLKVLRLIKQNFPKEFRSVHYEIVTPDGVSQPATQEAAPIDDSEPKAGSLKIFTGGDDPNGSGAT